ncbi:hypothetical protein G7Y89_g3830 [Cudoniella acicularis]|uniref:Heterokaryon incompatibility domain-containing protein n=1 Tax=Cudoniella acicularis TaxID=354080 RepID=A0A8H4W4U2_9HELO|nr:hypothetical protein G7Y89_g3830 [Cudoniella acicularis]
MSFKEWFQEYTATDADQLPLDSSIIQVANSDDLDADFIEQRIRESAPGAPITKGFCSKCQVLFDNWPTLGRSSMREHDSKPDQDEDGWEYAVARDCSTFELEASTRAGCKFCAFLLQSLKDGKILDTFRKIETRLYHLDEYAMPSLSVQNWGANPSQLLWLNFPGKVCTHCNNGIASSINIDSCFLPASANCYDQQLDTLDIATNWLSTCAESHELCKSSDGTLPTRLISLAGEQPQLVLTSEFPKRPQYATLSHSWGSSNTIKLTSLNLDSFMKAIPIEALPTTFKDAIKITRRLGIDFLWIDSLCIIQDSEDDWQRESALMSSVYGGSTITIAASSSRDSNEGCFLMPPDFNGGLRARISDGGRQRVQDFRNQRAYDLSTFETHLGTRAWALQEKMLPPRTIHFSNRGAFWECRTTIASQHLPDGFPKQLISPLVRRKGKFEWLWPQIVRLYSAANLTFEKDKLPALSGIARVGYNETRDQYLAGLWRGQIEEQLCWRRLNQAPLKRPSWRAPTWSWASIDGGVGWRALQKGILETKYIDVLDASTTIYSHDPFGQVTGGIIRLACSTMAAADSLVFSKSSDEPEAKDVANIVLRAKNQEQECLIQIDCLDDFCQEDNGPIHLLPLLSGRTGLGQREKGPEGWLDMVDEMMIQGIVLRATGIERGEFSRIGCFNFYKNRSFGQEVENEERRCNWTRPKLVSIEHPALVERVVAYEGQDNFVSQKLNIESYNLILNIQVKMSSLIDISHDDFAFTTAKAQAHLTLLRMFCGVYDLFGTIHPLAEMIIKRPYTPTEAEANTNHYLRIAHYRYTLYLDLLVSIRHTPKETWPAPQWDVALMMHTHMLSPVKFANDIASNPRYSSLAGLLDIPLMALQYKLQNIDHLDDRADRQRWQAKYKGIPFDVMQIHAITGQKNIPPRMVLNGMYSRKRFKFPMPAPFSLDLSEAVKRQISFARKITATYPYDPVPNAMLLDSQQRYMKFMNLIRLNATQMPVPALDIDLLWHTHQLTPSNYLPWCNHHLGRPIDHDDTIGQGELGTGLAQTISAWQAVYSEDYLNPSPNPSSHATTPAQTTSASQPSFPPQTGPSVPTQQTPANSSQPSTQASPSRQPIAQPTLTTADKAPPPGLTLNQLNLWNYDVDRQEKHEMAAYRLHQRRSQLAVYDNQLAALGPRPTSLMKRLTDPSTRKTLEANRNTVISQIQQDIKVQDGFRCAWGRGRWPLLVQARGWGYITPTKGEFYREPQASTSLDFPIYAATWYDQNELGYYDYVSGGRGGGSAIEGGGLPVGGGCRRYIILPQVVEEVDEY